MNQAYQLNVAAAPAINAKRPESLGSLLPYEEVIADDIVVCKDGSLGVVYKLELAEHEAMNEAKTVALVDSLKSWLTLPESTVLQVIFEQLPVPAGAGSLQSPIDGGGNPISTRLFHERLLALDGMVANSQLFERHGYVTVRWFPRRARGAGLETFFRDPNATLVAEINVHHRVLSEFRQLIASFEANSAMKLRRLGAQELLMSLRRFFNPSSWHQRPEVAYSPGQSLGEQVAVTDVTVDYAGIEREGLATRTISLKTSPSFVYPGGMAYFLGLLFPLRLVLNISFPSRAKVKKFFDLKEFFLENTPSARARRQREEVLVIQDRLAREDRCLHVSCHVTVEGADRDELDEKSRQILSVFNHRLECEAIVETSIGSAAAMASLPLCYHPASDLSLRRFIRMLRSDVTKFLPVFDSFRGLGTPLQHYYSREGNLVPFSLLENETSNHTVVLADSGAGKSSLIIDTVQAMKRLNPEPMVFIIDKKSSYKMLAPYFDAELTVFERGGDLPFSPFRGVFDEEKVAFLTRLLSTAIRLMSPNFELESNHLVALTKAIRLAQARRERESTVTFEGGELVSGVPGGDVTMTTADVVTELAGLPALAEFAAYQGTVDELVQKLAPFYGDGIYSAFFNAEPPVRKDSAKLFYIYDLDALDSDPALQCLMTMAVVEEIRQTIKQRRGEGRQGLLVLEELQMLGRAGGAGSQFVIDAAETFRKLGVWLVSLTPRPQNYFETEVGQALWGVADNFIFLQMSADNVDYVATRSALLDEAGIEIVKSLRTVRGSYADVFYTNKSRSKLGAFRFFQTSHDRWLAPTNAKAALMAEEVLRQHPGDPSGALEELVARYPGGLG